MKRITDIDKYISSHQAFHEDKSAKMSYENNQQISYKDGEQVNVNIVGIDQDKNLLLVMDNGQQGIIPYKEVFYTAMGNEDAALRDLVGRKETVEVMNNEELKMNDLCLGRVICSLSRVSEKVGKYLWENANKGDLLPAIVVHVTDERVLLRLPGQIQGYFSKQGVLREEKSLTEQFYPSQNLKVMLVDKISEKNLMICSYQKEKEKAIGIEEYKKNMYVYATMIDYVSGQDNQKGYVGVLPNGKFIMIDGKDSINRADYLPDLYETVIIRIYEIDYEKEYLYGAVYQQII